MLNAQRQRAVWHFPANMGQKKTETEIVIIIPQTFAYCKLCDTERKKHFTAAAEC